MTRVRHIKRGTTYTTLAVDATLQASSSRPKDCDRVTVYFDEQDGRVWVRANDEMGDGRFEAQPDTATAEFERKARWLVEQAARAGVVLTIEQRPLKPLAMGHYETVVSARAERPKG